MQTWPPAPASDERFRDAFAEVTAEAKALLRNEDTSRVDRDIIRYMRTANVMMGLAVSDERAYRHRIAVSLETVTGRHVPRGLLRVIRPSPEFDDIYRLPTAVTHAAMNGVRKRAAAVLADTLVADFYDQYAASEEMGVSGKELRKISPERYAEQLREIHEQIRSRTLEVI